MLEPELLFADDFAPHDSIQDDFPRVYGTGEGNFGPIADEDEIAVAIDRPAGEW